MKASNTTSSSEENYGALPSSYRRLRKSRSMHPSRSIRQIPFLKASKSLSRLSPRRGWRLAPSPAITDLQATRYKTDLDRLDSSARRSFREQYPDADCEKQWRYTTRSNIPVQPGDAISERSSSGAVKSSLRTFSATIRSRVKRFLSFTHLHQTHQTQLAEQHLDAFDVVANNHDARPIVDEADNKSFSDEQYDTVPHIVPPVASRDSLVSNSQSRVTSWTNSSVTSLGLRSASTQKHRLSVIKEDGGPHQPSSSAGRHIGGVVCVKSSRQTKTSAGPILPQVDSQRIYSALIKRISEEEAELERTRAAVEAIDSVKNPIQLDELPIARSDPTIRMVQSDSMLNSLVSLAQSPYNDDDTCHRNDGNSHSVSTGDTQAVRGSEKSKYTMDAQFTFFPSSPERRSTAPSPFRKLMSEKDDNNQCQDNSWSNRLASYSSIAEPGSDRSIYSTPSLNDISMAPAANGSLPFHQSAVVASEQPSAEGRSGQEKDQMGETPPVSTPGRFHFVSPTAVSTCTTPSPSLQHRFVARLSRPFNMDVPTQNRPFDSMYLGKRTPGHADTLGNSRLSVAPRKSKSYGALQWDEAGHFGDVQSSGHSAGIGSSSRTRAASKVMGILGSNRIVSNFLKSRRERYGGATEANSATDESPRFL
ncbi:hypothetical protein B0A52_06845 [Exophiala mesophila]|uniref:Uncharacterized protein n=1 Tax=Exophiala mesophila TaxID=212818 RepID=A0A438N0J4_EXOME|nr:hypothetical protein B0A52_06845 [Exophiala mesophila]